MKTKNVVAFGALSIAICLPGVAIGQDSGPYLGGAIGRSDLKRACDDLPAGLSCKKTAPGWKFFGGYQFTRYWGIEGEFAEFGKAKANGTFLGFPASADAQVWGWGLFGTGTLPVSRQFDLFAKLGFFRGIVDTRATVDTTTANLSGTATKGAFGAGAKWNFSGNWAARLEWERLKNMGTPATGSAGNVDFISVGIEYKL